jgi:hypothetical protein
MVNAEIAKIIALPDSTMNATQKNSRIAALRAQFPDAAPASGPAGADAAPLATALTTALTGLPNVPAAGGAAPVNVASPAAPPVTAPAAVPSPLANALAGGVPPPAPATANPATTPQAAPGPGAGAPAAAAPQMVRVQHPSGAFGMIPAEQVQDALSQGYKLAQ